MMTELWRISLLSPFINLMTADFTGIFDSFFIGCHAVWLPFTATDSLMVQALASHFCWNMQSTSA